MKPLLLLAAAVLALPAAAAGPAGAGGGHAIGSAPCFDEIVSSLSAQARGVPGRPSREPVLRAGPGDSEINGKGPSTSASFGATVPVYFHVIHNGAEGNVSDATIQQQIVVLNRAFRASTEA